MKYIYAVALISFLSYWLLVGLHAYAVPEKPFGSMPIIWPFTILQ